MWTMTRSGRKFYFDDIDPRQIKIQDIAHALSNICRFNGHCKFFYSVAQHSLLVSNMCEELIGKKTALDGLLHDSPEAYIADIAAPVKPFLRDYMLLEKRLETEIKKVFGVAMNDPLIRKADKIACLVEGLHLGFDTVRWDLFKELSSDPWYYRCSKDYRFYSQIRRRSQETIYLAFMSRFYSLQNGNKNEAYRG